MFSLKVKLDSLKSHIQNDARGYQQSVEEFRRLEQVGLRRADEIDNLETVKDQKIAESKVMVNKLEVTNCKVNELREKRATLVSESGQLNVELDSLRAQLST